MKAQTSAACEIRAVASVAPTTNRISGVTFSTEGGAVMNEDGLANLAAKCPELGTGLGQLASSGRLTITGDDLRLERGPELLVHLTGPIVRSSRLPFPLREWTADGDRSVTFHFVSRPPRSEVVRYVRSKPSYGASSAMPDFEFRYIPAGAFTRVPDGASVILSRGYEIQTTVVTQEQWTALTGENPSYFKAPTHCPDSYRPRPVAMCPRRPVEQVSYEDIRQFLAELNSRARDGYTYRLPTEAEWEYSAGAGDESGWDLNTAAGQTQDVARLRPNARGLFDMSGNVWEWVRDWYATLPSRAVVDPMGGRQGTHRVLRGGSWFYPAAYLRPGVRTYAEPTRAAYYDIGFRLARTRGSAN